MAEKRNPAWLEDLQRQVVFPAPRLEEGVLAEAAEIVGARMVPLRASDGVSLLGWHYEGARPGERIVLFFHGNAESILDRLALHTLVVSQGWDFFMVAYRGYPGSAGTPSEGGLRLDAQAAWNYVTYDLGIPRERMVVHGKSIGGGVAAALVADHEPGGLVMESTFTSITDVAQWRAPLPLGAERVRKLITTYFDTAARAPGITCPVLILHGDDDRVVPVDHGRALSPLFPNATYLEIPAGGHGESLTVVEPAARTAYLTFLEEIAERTSG